MTTKKIFNSAFNTDNIKETNAKTIITFVVVHIFLTTVVVFFLKDLYRFFYRITGGFIQGTLIANILMMVFVVGGVIFMMGRVKPRDVGLRLEDVKVGLMVTVGLWVSIQLTGLMVQLAMSGGVTINPLWSKTSVLVISGALLAQLLGNALQEEISFRGFLFVQLIHKLKSFSRPTTGVALALLSSQAIFAAMHIPIRLYNGASPLTIIKSLLLLIIIGTIFAVIYLRTGNLFVVVGVHALYNKPVSLFLSQTEGVVLLSFYTFILMLIWRRLKGNTG